MVPNDGSSLAEREQTARQLVHDALRASVPTNDDLSIVARRAGYELDNLAGDTLETRINDLTDKVVTRRQLNELIDALSDRSGNPKVAALADMDRLDDQPEQVTPGARLQLHEANLRVVIGSSGCVGFRLFNDGSVHREITFTATGIDNRWLTSSPGTVPMAARTEAPGEICISLPVDQGLGDETREVMIEARAGARLVAQAPMRLILLAIDKHVVVNAPVIDLGHSGPVQVGIENSTNEDLDVHLTVTTDVAETEIRFDETAVRALAGTEIAVTIASGRPKLEGLPPPGLMSARSTAASLSISGPYRRSTVGSTRNLGHYAIEVTVDHPAARATITGGNEVILSPRVTYGFLFWSVVLLGFLAWVAKMFVS